MAEEKKFNPLEMVIYEFRDEVGDVKKDVLAIRKLAFLQGTTYNEAMEGIFQLVQAVYKDKSTGDDGSNEPVVETAAFGKKSVGVTWCPCPFNINLIASIEQRKPLKIELKGCIEFSGGIRLNEHFDGEIGDNPLNISILNTNNINVNATITSKISDETIDVTFTIPVQIDIANQEIKNIYTKTIKIKL